MYILVIHVVLSLWSKDLIFFLIFYRHSICKNNRKHVKNTLGRVNLQEDICIVQTGICKGFSGKASLISKRYMFNCMFFRLIHRDDQVGKTNGENSSGVLASTPYGSCGLTLSNCNPPHVLQPSCCVLYWKSIARNNVGIIEEFVD